MAFYLAHAGATLQKIDVAGIVETLTLPAAVTMSVARRSRFAVLNNSVLVVNGPSINLRVRTSDMAVRPLSIPAPVTVVTVGAGAAGVLTGPYKYWTSFCERDAGVLISESPLSSVSATFTLTAQRAALSDLPVSTTTGVNDLRIYRSTSGGSVPFPLGYRGDNATLTYSDNTPDASLGSTSVDTDLGNPAGTTASDYLTQITEWKQRLWAVSNTFPDTVIYSGVGKWYAWPALNSLDVNPKGQGTSGLVAFLVRRDELGLAKRRSISKIVGTSSANYQIINVSPTIGVFAPESVVTIGDVVYFLSDDGVYAWDSSGVNRIDTERVAAWFTTDTYFNRARFVNAFAVWNKRENTYELHLAAAGSSFEDRWVSFDLARRVWLGPHKTDAFTPSCAAALEDADARGVLMVGGLDANLYRANDPVQSDGSTAIDFDVTTGVYSGGEPAMTKHWGALTVLTRPQSAGTLSVAPTVGTIDAVAQSALSHDLTLGRERLARLGDGELLSLRFRQNTNGQDCQIYGFEVEPVSAVGRR